MIPASCLATKMVDAPSVGAAPAYNHQFSCSSQPDSPLSGAEGALNRGSSAVAALNRYQRVINDGEKYVVLCRHRLDIMKSVAIMRTEWHLHNDVE